MSIDFTPITESRYYKRHVGQLGKLKKHRFSWMSPGWFVVFIVIGLIIFGPAFLFLLVAILVIYIVWWFRTIAEITPIIREFCNRNGFRAGGFVTSKEAPSLLAGLYSENEAGPLEVLPYQLTSVSGSQSSIIGTINNYRFTYSFSQLSSYRQDIHGRKKERAFSFCVTMQPRTAAALPSLFIASKKQRTSSRQYRLSKDLRARLYTFEGDFSQDFQVYAADNTGVHIFETLSPEVLALIKDAFQCDIWMHQNTITLIIPLARFSTFVTAIPHLLPLMEALALNIDAIQRLELDSGTISH